MSIDSYSNHTFNTVISPLYIVIKSHFVSVIRQLMFVVCTMNYWIPYIVERYRCRGVMPSWVSCSMGHMDDGSHQIIPIIIISSYHRRRCWTPPCGVVIAAIRRSSPLRHLQLCRPTGRTRPRRGPGRACHAAGSLAMSGWWCIYEEIVTALVIQVGCTDRCCPQVRARPTVACCSCIPRALYTCI